MLASIDGRILLPGLLGHLAQFNPKSWLTIPAFAILTGICGFRFRRFSTKYPRCRHSFAENAARCTNGRIDGPRHSMSWWWPMTATGRLRRSFSASPGWILHRRMEATSKIPSFGSTTAKDLCSVPKAILSASPFSQGISTQSQAFEIKRSILRNLLFKWR